MTTETSRDAQLMEEVRREWHTDRKVTLGLIAGLLFNAGSFIWYASRIDYTVQIHGEKFQKVEERFAVQEKALSDARSQSSAVSDRLTRIETSLGFQNETLKEIKQAIKNDKIK